MTSKSPSSRLGQFFVLSAPSGAGKTTLANRLFTDFPDIMASISCTTRPPRAGEKDGVDYYFIDEELFRQRIAQGDFFEWEEVHGYLYGTPRDALMQRRERGGDTVLDIDVKGALSVKNAFPESHLIFVMPPSLEDLEKRLMARKTEKGETLKRRLDNAKWEMAERDKFDYVIVNDDLDRAYAELKKIILTERA